MVVSTYGRLEWVGVIVVVECVAGRAGESEGGVGVCCVGMGGVCGRDGRRREGEGGAVDAGFVLPVANVKNSSNTTNTTSQSVRWPPSLVATENSPDCSCRQARFSPLSLDACLHLCSFDPSLSPSSSSSNLAGLVVVACSINTEVQGSGKKSVGQNKLEVVSSSSLGTPRHASCPSCRRPPDHQDPPLLMMSRRVEKKRKHIFSFLLPPFF